MRKCKLLCLGSLMISLFGGCASAPPKGPPPPPPLIERSGQITRIALPAGCGPVQLRITMTQDASLTPGGTGAHVEGTSLVQNGSSSIPDLSNFDLTKTVKIDVVVVIGNCPPFVPPAAWHFEGTLQSLGSGQYAVDFSGFQKVH